MDASEVFQKMKEELPALFAGTSLDSYTGEGYRWRTLQNEKSRGEVPPEVFLRHGSRKLLVVRDAFLAYWQAKIERT